MRLYCFYLGYSARARQLGITCESRSRMSSTAPTLSLGSQNLHRREMTLESVYRAENWCTSWASAGAFPRAARGRVKPGIGPNNSWS